MAKTVGKSICGKCPFRRGQEYEITEQMRSADQMDCLKNPDVICPGHLIMIKRENVFVTNKRRLPNGGKV